MGVSEHFGCHFKFIFKDGDRSPLTLDGLNLHPDDKKWKDVLLPRESFDKIKQIEVMHKLADSGQLPMLWGLRLSDRKGKALL